MAKTMIFTFEKFAEHKKEFGEVFSGILDSNENFDIKRFIETDLDHFNAARHVIDDTSDAIKSFIQSGGFSDVDRGLSLLKLYGVLNATYIQQEIVKNITGSTYKEIIDSLRIREGRNFIGSHPLRRNNTERIHSGKLVVLHPNECRGFNLSYTTRGDYKMHNLDLKSQLEEHLKFMSDFFCDLNKKIITLKS